MMNVKLRRSTTRAQRTERALARAAGRRVREDNMAYVLARKSRLM